MQIIDTHLHLVYRPEFTLPWLGKFPTIDQSWTADAYFAEATALGITAALHMEADVDERQMLQEAAFMATAHPKVIGTIAACRPESHDFAQDLAKLETMSHVRGVRRVLHVMPDALSQTTVFVDNIRLLAKANLTFDICVRANQLHLAYDLAAAAPQVQFILDHCGNPDVANNGFDDWSSALKQLAELPNVAAKMSGIAVNAAPDWTTATLRPYVEFLIQTFGWDRVVWGSDHPVLLLNGSLSKWVEASLTITDGANAEDRAKLFNGNAKRIYRLHEKL
jgi:predicted TIM-barrel fold metal-dependent hydrolase